MSDKAVLFCDTVGTEKRILDLFEHETPKSSSIELVLQDGFTFDKSQYELRGVKLIFDNEIDFVDKKLYVGKWETHYSMKSIINYFICQLKNTSITGRAIKMCFSYT